MKCRSIKPVGRFFATLYFGVSLTTTLQAHEYEAYARSALGTSRAYAGEVTKTSDASVVFANPAAMSKVYSSNTSVVLHVMQFVADYDAPTNAAASSLEIDGKQSGDMGGFFGGPNVYWMSANNSAWRFGFGLNTPYAYGTDYKSDWAGRYHGTRSLLTTFAFTSSVSYAFNDSVSVGFSVPVNYVQAEFDRALNQNAMCISSNLICDAPPNTFATTDAKEKIAVSGTSVGATVGAHYRNPRTQTDVGFVYRAEESPTLSGDASYSRVDAVLSNANIWNDTSVDTDFILPASFTFGLSQPIGNKIVVMTDISWKEWSRFSGWEFDYKHAAQQNQKSDVDWKDGLRSSVGLDYQLNDRTTLHAGYAYDNSPVESRAGQSPLIPGADIQWYSFGASLQLDQSILTMGYSYLNYKNSNLDIDGGPTKGRLTSRLDMKLHLFSFQYDFIL